MKIRRDFVYVMQKGNFFASSWCVVHWVRTKAAYVRLGMSVSSKYGSAVLRNKFRRRVREAFRLSDLAHGHGIDIHIKPKKELFPEFSACCQLFSQLEDVIKREDHEPSSSG